jgi:rare lipoprotein A (peptidoglycan hydrolase)
MPIHDWNRTYGCARILLLALLVVVVSNGGTQAQTTAPSGGSFEERFIFGSFEELFSSRPEAAPAPVPSRDETVRPRISKETVQRRISTETAASPGTSTRPPARPSIPLPDRALLTPPPDLNCEFKAANTDPGADAALQTKLDYERQCYRHAAMIAHDRLRNLQASVGETIQAVGRGAQPAVPLPERALLTSPAQFDCEFKTASPGTQAGSGADGALRTKLDYEGQCYRHAEMIARDRLRRLQAAVGETIRAVKGNGRAAVEPPPRASREPARVGEQRPQPRTAKKIVQRQTSEPAAGARNAKRLASKSGRRIAGGLATWHEQLGRKASRTKYNPNARTAAHKTLRLGTRVRVVNLLNKRSVTVRISDRAPSKMKNVIDLSRGSARAIGLTDVPVALYKLNGNIGASDSTAKATSFTSTSGFAGQTTKTAEPTDPPERPGTPVAGRPSAESATTGMATQEVAGNAVLQLDREEIAMFRRRGEELVLAGDIIAARLLLQRAAEDRDAGAALALGATYDPIVLERGATYDPIVLERLGVYALAADITTARTWYEKAKEFGSAEAPRRLELLATLGH